MPRQARLDSPGTLHHVTQTFNFLGFTHFVSQSRRGQFAVGRKTEGKRISKKLKLLNERVQALRVEGGKAMMVYVQQHLRGPHSVLRGLTLSFLFGI